MAKKTLYLDCYSGIAGDMTLAALIDLGADLDKIVAELKKLPIDPFEIEVTPVVKQGISAKYLKIHLHNESHEHHHDHEHSHDGHHHEHHHNHSHDHHGHSHDHDDHSHHDEHGQHHHHEHEHSHHDHHHHHGHDHGGHHHHHDHVHRKASDIIAMIESSSLSSRVKVRSTAIFREIAVAEGKIHGMSPDDVHFHEVGAMDSIIDIIGVCIALELLEIDTIIASPVPTGFGRMKMAHGLYPIPAPATLELLRGIPLSSLQVEGELTTPTGAGILQALATGFGPMPAMQVERIGYGAGRKDFAHPNVIRAILMGDPDLTNPTHDKQGIQHDGKEQVESITVLEAQLDDFRGELLGYVMDQLFAVGALDVYYTSIYMKKNRPGTLITVLAAGAQVEACEKVLLEETSTFGVRRSNWIRRALGRRWLHVETRYGTIRVKQALRDDQVIHSSPEYEDAVEAARQYQVSLQAVYDEVMRQVDSN